MSDASDTALFGKVNIPAIIDLIKSNWEEFKDYCWYAPSAEETLRALEEFNDHYVP